MTENPIDQSIQQQEVNLDQERERNQVLLREFIRSQGGRISFDQFMEFSLYDPKHGYYQKRAVIGTTHEMHDFYTYAESPILATSVLQSLKSVLKKTGSTFVELAGGEGTFKENALWLMQKLGLESKYISVDISRKMIELQREVGPEATQAKAHNLPFSDSSIEGAFFANELIDALPHKTIKLIHQKNPRGYYEVVGIQELFYKLNRDDSISEEWLSPTDEALEYWNSVLEYLGERGLSTDIFTDDEMSFPPTSLNVLQEMIRSLKSGKIVLIDYGELLENLVGEDQIEGGLYIYQYPRENSVPLSKLHTRVFENDMTCNVNFSYLIQVAKKMGCSCAFYSQDRFCDLQMTDDLFALSDDAQELSLKKDKRTMQKVNPLGTQRGWSVLVITVDKKDEIVANQATPSEIRSQNRISKAIKMIMQKR